MNESLFPKKEQIPRVIKVEARQYPVSMHFTKVTKDEYVEEAFKKVCKIHKELPPGGILVFLTGKKEISYVSKRLYMALSLKKKGKKGKRIQETVDDDSALEFDGEREQVQLDV